MSPLQGREPGAVGAALEDRDSWIGIIVDGVHVHPASLRVAALLSKPSRRKVEVPVEYLGFTIPDAFVYGYGLDRSQYDRNLPFITSQE